jgi:hypothetical protein
MDSLRTHHLLRTEVCVIDSLEGSRYPCEATTGDCIDHLAELHQTSVVLAPGEAAHDLSFALYAHT